MLDRVIDNLSRLESLTPHIPSIIQIMIFLLWIGIIRKSKIGYKTSLIISLFLLSLSGMALLINLNSLSGTLSEYAFLFLGIGIIQATFYNR